MEIRALSTREWLLIIVIMTIAEFNALRFIWTNAENTDVVNLISLGSAFTSIALALVAIIISLLQFFSQADESRQVSRGISDLLGVVKDVKNANESLREGTKDFRSILESQAEIRKALEGHGADLKSIQQDLGAKIEKVSIQAQTSPAIPGADVKGGRAEPTKKPMLTDDEFLRMCSTVNFGTALSIFSLARGAGGKKDIAAIVKDIMLPSGALKPAGGDGDGVIDFRHGILFGSTSAVANLFRDLGVITSEWNQVPAFRGDLARRAVDFYLGGAKSGDDDSSKAILKIEDAFKKLEG